MKLGEICIREKAISEHDLILALNIQKDSGGLIGQIFMEMECIDYISLVRCLAIQKKELIIRELSNIGKITYFQLFLLNILFLK